ncbi:MAG: 3-oxoacyl-[acyl-carrier-protein] reductase [Vampirovibrionales bacterium]
MTQPIETNQTNIALVTGGSRGLGRACVMELAKEGFTVLFTYRSQAQQAEETKAQALASLPEGSTATVEGYQVDMNDQEAMRGWVNDVLQQYGRIDVLVNNAGITRDTLTMRMKDEDWSAVIETNLSSVFFLIREVIKPMMKQRRGKIINISSVVGVHGNAGQVNYAASKAGLIGMTKSLAKELGSRQINVNAIAPGFIQTDMTHGLDTEAFKERLAIKRMGHPEDIAEMVGFLATKGSYITGQVFLIDGGLAL